MCEFNFALRLANLRMQKGVSAREMSLALGMNTSYINSIECGKALPAMKQFFYICDFLDVSPAEFFNTEQKNPNKLTELNADLQKLDVKELENISAIVKSLINK